VGFGIGHELAARPVEVQGLTNAYCREKLYWGAQKADKWPGGAYPGGKPFYEGTSVLAGMKTAKKLGWIGGYRWAFDINQVLMGLSWDGPCVLGLWWYEGMSRPDRKGYIKPTGRRTGGHCILAKSVNIRKSRLTLHNSWGKAWGVEGDCYIDINDLAQLLREDGEAVFAVDRMAA